jgi:hypothetical protein
MVVTAGGRGVASRAGSRLLTDLAEATGLTAGFAHCSRPAPGPPAVKVDGEPHLLGKDTR